MARRRRNNFKRQVALFATWLVLAQHVLLSVVFALDRYRPGLFHVPELWALDRRWQFYLLIAVVMGSGSLTIVAWRSKAPVRLTLLMSWLLLTLVMVGFHADRLQTMARLMWKHG